MVQCCSLQSTNDAHRLSKRVDQSLSKSNIKISVTRKARQPGITYFTTVRTKHAEKWSEKHEQREKDMLWVIK